MYRSNSKTHYMLSVNMELLYLDAISSIQDLTQHCWKTHPALHSRWKPGLHDGAGLGVHLHSIMRADGEQISTPTRKPNSLPSVGGGSSLWAESIICKQNMGSKHFLFFGHIKSAGRCSLLNWWHFIFPCLLEQLVYCITKMEWMRHYRRKQSH